MLQSYYQILQSIVFAFLVLLSCLDNASYHEIETSSYEAEINIE